jgi:hypothetical protein
VIKLFVLCYRYVLGNVFIDNSVGEIGRTSQLVTHAASRCWVLRCFTQPTCNVLTSAIFFAISQILGGCGKSYRVDIPRELRSTESILCGEHPNFVGSEQKDILTKFSIRLYSDQKSRTSLVLINARQILADGGEGPREHVILFGRKISPV